MPNKKITYYRCGWCGTATTEEGKVLKKHEINKEQKEETNYYKAEAVNGECCSN